MKEVGSSILSSDTNSEEAMSLSEKIESIPGSEGWWKSSGKEDFLKMAQTLIAKGFSEEEAVSLLESAYHAVSGEFGS